MAVCESLILEKRSVMPVLYLFANNGIQEFVLVCLILILAR
jgi:hypothetical protein